MNDTDARLWHPWLRINRVLRAMLTTRWNAEAWPQVRAEFKTALALRSQIWRAGWFNWRWRENRHGRADRHRRDSRATRCASNFG